MKSGKLFLGILAGAGAGALLGILFAPRNGKDTRKRITNTSKDYADNIKKHFDATLNQLTGKLKKAKAEAKEEASEYANNVKAKEQKLKKDYGVEIS